MVPRCACRNRQGECGSVAVCILPSAPAADQQSPQRQRQQKGTSQDTSHVDGDSDSRSLEDRGFAVNEDLGFLAAPLDASPQEIYSHVEVRFMHSKTRIAALLYSQVKFLAYKHANGNAADVPARHYRSTPSMFGARSRVCLS